MEDFQEKFIKSGVYELMKDIYALHDFLQVKDEDIINKGCLIEDLESFANGYITFLNKDGEKKILTSDDIANFEPEIIDGKRLYRIDIVVPNRKRLAQNEDDFKEIWNTIALKNNLNLDDPFVFNQHKEDTIRKVEQLKDLHIEITKSNDDNNTNLFSLSNRFIAFLKVIDKPVTSNEGKNGFDLGLDKPQLEGLHKALIDANILKKGQFVKAFTELPLIDFDKLEWVSPTYGAIFCDVFKKKNIVEWTKIKHLFIPANYSRLLYQSKKSGSYYETKPIIEAIKNNIL